MCVSAMEEQNLNKLARQRNAKANMDQFEALFQMRLADKRIKISKALELNFEEPRSAPEQRIKQSIGEYRIRQSQELQQELFKQKKRLGDAERKLKTKSTHQALEHQRIATHKIDALVRRIADVNRTELLERDSRFFPFYFVPIIINDGKSNSIMPARYHCRPSGKPAAFDTKFPGLYNARRDNLEGFWKEQFGAHHAVIAISAFFENVPLHKYEHRELRPGEAAQNIVLQFNPKPPIEMNVACLWSHWQSPGEPDLVSFAAITDDPPPEISAAGHDRVVITLRPENVDAWLSPSGSTKESLYKLLDDQDRPHFDLQKAA